MTSLRSYRDDFDALVRTCGEAIAAVDAKTEREYTYAELAELVSRTEAHLASLGLTPGKTLVSLLPNSLEAVLIFLAAARMGLSFAPFSALSRPREVVEWSKMVSASLVMVAEPQPSETVAALEAVGIPVTGLRADGSLQFPAEITERSADRPPPGRIYLQTSGTTGKPKVIVIDLDRLWSSAHFWVAQHPDLLRPGARVLNYLPIAYLGGLYNLCMIPMAAGGSFVIGEAFSGTSLLNFWSDVERFEVDTLWLVPSILRGLLALHERTRGKHARAYRQIRGAFIGTAIIDRETKEQGEQAFGFPILENFALSETTFITSEHLETAPGTHRGVGRALPYVEMRLDPLVPSGEGLAEGVGEIQVRSPYLFLGYLQPDGSLDAAREDNGFFATGDLGRLGADGQTLHLEGRIRDIIKKGGYLISLNEIENVALLHPAVAEASAVGVSHEFYGEDVNLFVRFHPGGEEDPVGVLRIWLTDNLAKFKWPNRITPVDELPRTSSGKVQKFRLAGRAERDG